MILPPGEVIGHIIATNIAEVNEIFLQNLLVHLIFEKTEDEKLHALRIECKKLRYLIEFFSSLFARQTIDTLIKQLKKLQDNLGDFNDLCVQQDYLMNIAEEMPATDPNSKKVLVAIGSLIGTLDRNKQIVKNAFAKTYTDFAAPPNKRLFQDLFASKPKEVTA